MREWKTVARIDDLPAGGSCVIDFDGRAVALFREGDQVYAIDDRCPHAGASLCGGAVEAGVVTCPWHDWQFRLTDGAWVGNPRIRTAAYDVRVEGGEIQLATRPA